MLHGRARRLGGSPSRSHHIRASSWRDVRARCERARCRVARHRVENHEVSAGHDQRRQGRDALALRLAGVGASLRAGRARPPGRRAGPALHRGPCAHGSARVLSGRGARAQRGTLDGERAAEARMPRRERWARWHHRVRRLDSRRFDLLARRARVDRTRVRAARAPAGAERRTERRALSRDRGARSALRLLPARRGLPPPRRSLPRRRRARDLAGALPER